MTELFRECFTCWVNGFIAKPCGFCSISLRLLCLLVADPNAFSRMNGWVAEFPGRCPGLMG